MPPGLWIAFRAVLESGEAARWAATLADLKSAAARARTRERLAAQKAPEIVTVELHPRLEPTPATVRPGHSMADWLAQRDGKPAAGMIDGLSDETF